MSIFTKPINDIAYKDVIDFCEKSIPEGVFLDYKVDFPPENEKLAKTIAAFANTQGGVLLIGVGEEDSKPKPPFEGIHYRDKLQERVEDIILGNIRPPVFSEIQVVPNSDKSKAFVVIRIPPSNDAHYLNTYKAVYVRTGSSSHPEDVASPEQIEWLMDRRKKSVELRESILSRAEERFSNSCLIYKINQQDLKGLCTFSIVPFYPQKPLVGYEEIPDIANKIKTDSHYFSAPYPFGIYGAEPKRVQGGIAHFACSERASGDIGRYLHSWELNHFGLFMHKNPVGYEQPLSGGQHKYQAIKNQEIYSLTCLFLSTALKLYRLLGFWGLLKVQLRIENTLGLIPLTYEAYERCYSPDRFSVVDKGLLFERQPYVKELEEDLENVLISILSEVFWALGVEREKQKIRDSVRKLEPNIFQNLDSSLRSE